MARIKEHKYNDNNLAIAYYRYSSDRQDTSNEQQAKAAHAYADAHGFTIIREYADEAISGSKNDRKDYQRMLAEINTLKPEALILWKTDRFSRSDDARFDKMIIRNAGCRIHYVAEVTPDDSPESLFMENIMEDMATYYLRQLSCNVKRGQEYNYERGLYLGVKMLGYTTEGEGRHNKRYIPDPVTAPIVQMIFSDYVGGMSMQDICNKLNGQGIRTVRNKLFTVNSIRAILKNPAYTGVYKYADHVKEDGMPVLVSKELYEKAQQKLGFNKKFGAQNARGLDDNKSPRFWLTGKLYCGECGESMQGTSGTSRTGAKHYYYSCNDQHKGRRGKGCKKKPIRKDWIEKYVCKALSDYLSDSENLASLAVDVAAYYQKEYTDHNYLDSLKANLAATEKAIDNIIKAIIAGASGETINNELHRYEEQKKALSDAIMAEEIRYNALQDKISATKFFEKYMNANLDDWHTRDLVLDYFVDKIYLYDDRLIITGNFDDDERGMLFVEVEKHKSKKGSTTPCSCALLFKAFHEVSWRAVFLCKISVF
ncbi:MAG: recombinase family protein [Lachnospiraceae bacterium]|nr:recombinase family protein [Lachnospiraceae bacterium]